MYRLGLVACFAVGISLLFMQSGMTKQSMEVIPERSLFITDKQILEHNDGDTFALERVFKQLVRQSKVRGLTAVKLWQQLWDTERPGPSFGFGPNCDDEIGPHGEPSINGFPITCPRTEGDEAELEPFAGPAGTRLYNPIALVNRFDLAPLDGAHCGEYRIIYARRPEFGGRNFLIFEAVLPNPSPYLGLQGCRPVAEFWADLSQIHNLKKVARKLAKFYFRGLRGGFSPVVHINHYGPQGGQIRTNQFLQFPWLLREFQLVHHCEKRQCNLLVTPMPVQDTPFGELFSDTSTLSLGPAFQRDFLDQMPSLLPDDVNGFSIDNADMFYAGQSDSQTFAGESDYPFHFEQGQESFAAALQDELHALGSTLQPIHMVRRALAMSCAGCHMLSTFFPNNDLGQGVIWPASNGFVHVMEDGQISPALRDVFLPHRQVVLEQFLAGTFISPREHVLRSDTSVPMTIGGPRRAH